MKAAQGVSVAGERITVVSDGVELAVWQRGPADAPVVLLVHGYPDSHTVWDLVGNELAATHRVVVYDVRGSGRSDAPSAVDAYRIEKLLNDLAAVINSVAPTGGVHLVGHDWGSIQCWSAVTDPRIAPLLSSFTSMSGPGLAHVNTWMGEQFRGGVADVGDLLGQGIRSWYIAAFQTPLAPVVWKWGLARRWASLLKRNEGARVDQRWPGSTVSDDAVNGIKLYKANFGPFASRPQPQVTNVPVQLLVATKDSYVTVPLVEFAGRFARTLRRRDIDSGHWAPRSAPELVASAVADFVGELERSSV